MINGLFQYKVIYHSNKDTDYKENSAVKRGKMNFILEHAQVVFIGIYT